MSIFIYEIKKLYQSWVKDSGVNGILLLINLNYKMKNVFMAIVLMIGVLSCSEGNEKVITPKVEDAFAIPTADDILLQDYNPVKVMLIGSWHFSYPNADSHKTSEENMIDLESPQKQKEIIQVVDRLTGFKPTIICLELQNQRRLDSLYKSYISNEYELRIEEDQQLGFRVAKNMKLNKLFAVDSYSWLRENGDDFQQLENLWDEEFHLDTLDRISWAGKYEKWYNEFEKIPSEYSVDNALRIMNHPQNLKRMEGHYLVEMKTSNHNGPDAYSLKWYDRNIRIFNKVLKTNPMEGDKILIIMGAGHISILEQLFDTSPQFELVRPYTY